jgi:MFS superfamily sulfate permease-like transporter
MGFARVPSNTQRTYKQLIHLGLMVMQIDKHRHKKLLIWSLIWIRYLLYIAMENLNQVMMKMIITLIVITLISYILFSRYIGNFQVNLF